MALHTPRISIGMPLYNGEQYVEQALQSLLDQTFADFEVIISDNASKDGTAAICRKYAQEDERFQYFRNEQNLGAAKNFNRVFERARGLYFKWAAYDDVCAPTFLERCVEVLDARPEVVLSYPRTTLIDTEGKAIKTFEDGLDLRSPRPYQRLYQLVTQYNLSNALYGLIRTDVLRKTTLVEPYIASDYPLLVEICLHGQFWEVPEKLFYRRQHEHSVRRLSIREYARWFKPSSSGMQYRFRSTRLFFKQLAAIKRTPLAFNEKFLCCLQLGAWVLRRCRNTGGRYKAKLKKRLFNR